MQGVRLELRAANRVGLLSDITRVLRENGLAVVRADVATQGEKSVHAFYLRDISGNEVGMDFVESMRKEMGPIHLEVKNETPKTPSTPTRSTHIPTSPAAAERSRFSFGYLLKSQIERFSQNFVPIK